MQNNKNEVICQCSEIENFLCYMIYHKNMEQNQSAFVFYLWVYFPQNCLLVLIFLCSCLQGFIALFILHNQMLFFLYDFVFFDNICDMLLLWQGIKIIMLSFMDVKFIAGAINNGLVLSHYNFFEVVLFLSFIYIQFLHIGIAFSHKFIH